MNTNWKERTETWTSKMEAANLHKTWTEIIDLAPGIKLYKNVLKKDLDIINRINSVLGEEEGETKRYNWAMATVGYRERMPDYRDCMDFKFKKKDIAVDPHEDSLALQSIWQDCYDHMIHAVNDYRGRHNIMDLRYWEAMNFIKYGVGQHFQEHHDHGHSYNCTVSLVAYLNDDYEGGEIEFKTWNLKYKPEAGDLIIFPSNYMYPHKANQVTSGVKYSLVTMLDYSEKYHTPEMYQETGT